MLKSVGFLLLASVYCLERSDVSALLVLENVAFNRSYDLLDGPISSRNNHLEVASNLGSRKFVNENNNGTSSSQCYEPESSRICSGKGLCNNNKCQCDKIEVVAYDGHIDDTYRYSGDFCEECPYCKGQRCEKYLPCIICRVIGNEALCPTCPGNFKKQIEVVRNITNDDKMCDVEYETGCYVKYKYFYKNGEVYLEAEDQYQCFDGNIYIFYPFWGFVFFLLLLAVTTPYLYLIGNGYQEIDQPVQDHTMRRRFHCQEIRPSSVHDTSL